MPQSINKHEELAHKIAKSLKEEKDIKLYLYIVKHYKESAIRRAFQETMLVPDEKIKKTRSALFFYLLKKYDREKD